jgi:hypothetical protein
MTVIKKILNAAKDGGRFSSQEVMETVVVEITTVRNLLSAAVKAGYLRCEKVYVITPLGIAKASHIPVTRRSREERNAVHTALRHKHLGARRAAAAIYAEQRAVLAKERQKVKDIAAKARAERSAEKNARAEAHRAKRLVKPAKPVPMTDEAKEAHARTLRMAQNESMVAQSIRRNASSVFDLGRSM